MSAWDYMNSSPEPSYQDSVSGDLDMAFDNDPATFGSSPSAWRTQGG